MEDLSLHILDLAENSTAAGASLVRIAITEDVPADWLTVEIEDNGRGLDRQILRHVADQPAVEEPPPRVGLGLPLFFRSCQDAGGRVQIESEPGQGTKIRGTLRLSALDRIPVGSYIETLISLLMGSPGIDWLFSYDKVPAEGQAMKVALDTREVRTHIGNVPLNHSEVLRSIRGRLREQMARLEEAQG